MSAQILVIEDEPTLSRLLSYNLTQEGYEVTSIEEGYSGLQAALSQPFDLILLDIMLPNLNGFELLTKLRANGNKTPVIILTARNAEEEIVRGLKCGADDYMTKPFGVAELLARVSAILRRSNYEGVDDINSEEQRTDGQKVISFGELTIYPEKYEVLLQGNNINVRPKEFEVLLHLVRRPGTVMTRDHLMDAVWGYDYIGGQRTVDVHVSSLRKKLELNQDQITIESIRGVGYKIMRKK